MGSAVAKILPDRLVANSAIRSSRSTHISSRYSKAQSQGTNHHKGKNMSCRTAIADAYQISVPAFGRQPHFDTDIASLFRLAGHADLDMFRGGTHGKPWEGSGRTRFHQLDICDDTVFNRCHPEFL